MGEAFLGKHGLFYRNDRTERVSWHIFSSQYPTVNTDGVPGANTGTLRTDSKVLNDERSRCCESREAAKSQVATEPILGPPTECQPMK